MRNRIFLAGVIAIAVYILSNQMARARNKNYEDLRHQVERLWRDPHARKARKALAKKSRRAAKDAVEAVAHLAS